MRLLKCQPICEPSLLFFCEWYGIAPQDYWDYIGFQIQRPDVIPEYTWEGHPTGRNANR